MIQRELFFFELDDSECSGLGTQLFSEVPIT